METNLESLEVELKPFGAEYLEEIYDPSVPGSQFGSCTVTKKCGAGADSTQTSSSIQGETTTCDTC